MQLIDGKATAAEIKAEIAEEVRPLTPPPMTIMSNSF